MIRVENIVKTYNNIKAVDDIGFEIEENSIYAFLGPNGAGKTTTMRILTNYIMPQKGNVFINNINIIENPEKAKKYIGYLPENPPLYFDLTVLEYLRFISTLKQVEQKNINKHIDAIMNLTGILKIKNRLIGNLSKGYKQRIGLAQAMIGDPKILILDEPTIGLDPQQIIGIRNLIKSLSENKTVLLSTHILSEASMVCKKIIIINHGKILANGSQNELQQMVNPANKYELIVLNKYMENFQNILNQSSSIIIEKTRQIENKTCFTIIVSGDEDAAIKFIFFQAAENNIFISQIKKVEFSLEEIFIKLISGEI